MEESKCFVCNSKAYLNHDMDPIKYFFTCPVCGRYEYYPLVTELTDFNMNHLGAYLVYNGFRHNSSVSEYRYFTTMSKEKCDLYYEKFKKGDTSHGHPVKLLKENVEAWYPKTFAEKVDQILLYLCSKIKFMGDYILFDKEEMYSSFFVDRFDENSGEYKRLSDECLTTQKDYMQTFLISENYIKTKFTNDGYNEWNIENPISLTPNGYARVDMLQKDTSNSKNVLVAMKFGEDTSSLREAIRKGITDANYNAIFIDEVEHNDFITPELLKHIRDSKFVVVDLTHQNNGAYFEEGYAMGLGKPVIQLCKKDVNLHFDIAQKNTIIWGCEDDIPERLNNRIIATID